MYGLSTISVVYSATKKGSSSDMTTAWRGSPVIAACTPYLTVLGTAGAIYVFIARPARMKSLARPIQ